MSAEPVRSGLQRGGGWILTALADFRGFWAWSWLASEIKSQCMIILLLLNKMMKTARQLHGITIMLVRTVWRHRGVHHTVVFTTPWCSPWVVFTIGDVVRCY